MTQLAHDDGASGVRAGPGRIARDLAHGYTTADIGADREQVARYGSLCRVIEGAPLQNKLAVFAMMAKTAASEAAALRQQYIDDLWSVAGDLELVRLFGTDSVQATLCAAFDGETTYDDRHDGLSSSFARACRDADREHRRTRRPPAQRPVNRLPESTRQAVEWLLKHNDADRLKKFIAEHSPSEAQVIVGYIKGRRS
jgi:hypothetical protein